jgi:hypothetical protein
MMRTSPIATRTLILHRSSSSRRFNSTPALFSTTATTASETIACATPTTTQLATLLLLVADMRFHIAGKYLVAQRFDHPLVAAGQMQPRGVFESKIAGIQKARRREIALRGRRGIVHIPQKCLRPAKADVANLAGSSARHRRCHPPAWAGESCTHRSACPGQAPQ